MKRSAERIKFLDDVVSCFIEDYGANPWRRIVSYQFGGEMFGRPEGATYCTFEDVEADEGTTYVVDIDTVARGLAALARGEGGMVGFMRGPILAANAENDAWNIDAYDADAIVQLAVFGQLVYG